jgi:predicted ATP-dependent protease
VAVTPLEAQALFRRYDPGHLDFETTEQVEDMTAMLGQPRAEAALEVGTGISGGRFHIFAHGLPGTGRRHLVLQTLTERARSQPSPPDLCYVYDFTQEHRPRLLTLPSGRGSDLRRDMERLVEDLRAGLTTAFEGEEYHARREKVDEEFKARPRQAFETIEERAKAEGLGVLRTPTGFAVAPLRDGQLLASEEFGQLPTEEQQQIQARMDVIHDEIQRTVRQFPRWAREHRERIRALDQEVSRGVADHLLDDLRREYTGLDGVQNYLDAVQKDVVDNARDLIESPDQQPMRELFRQPGEGPWVRRYRVNVLVDNGGRSGAPVIEEDNPTYDNLVGRIDHVSHFGALVTDFTLLKAGALLRANGGFLVLQAHQLLRAPLAYDALKRALESERLRIESLGHALGLVTTLSLEPEPVPLNVQVVLLGEPYLYYLLSALDPDFEPLFKVAADFAEDMEAGEAATRQYVGLLATLARSEKLKPFDRAAIARILEQSARLAGDQRKLSIRMAPIVDLLRESSYRAGTAGAEAVSASHVQGAIDAQIYRQDRLRERSLEAIDRGLLLIDTTGAQVGKINALSALPLGGFTFARPTRVTARVRLGGGDLIDIQREVELGGPVHSKGVLILGGYLASRYAGDAPLSLWASLVFEQSYGEVEGDSASLAELCALLSAISEVPIRQGVAVTGSVNQHGDVQPVGAVNEKIEGFFDVCRQRGLTGEQGVVIPAANASHLMLRQDVVDAVAAGRFQVWPVTIVDQAIEILTGMPPAERNQEGTFPEGSFNAMVEDRLAGFAESRRAYGGLEITARVEGDS